MPEALLCDADFGRPLAVAAAAVWVVVTTKEISLVVMVLLVVVVSLVTVMLLVVVVLLVVVLPVEELQPQCARGLAVRQSAFASPASCNSPILLPVGAISTPAVTAAETLTLRENQLERNRS